MSTAPPAQEPSTANNMSVPQPEYQNTLIPESDESSQGDNDSAVGGLSYASSTTSARSDVYNAVEEFGRMYHGYKAGKYIFPNDQPERDRLDLQHMLFLETLDGKLTDAPIDDPRHVLDIATGTGLWAVEFAEQYPRARVVGTDLSPIQPAYVPVNCSFEIHDCEDEWSFSRPFDYIHGRALLTCFSDLKSIVQKAYDSLAPGGYLEFQDALIPLRFLDPQPPPDHPIRVFGELCLEAAEKLGRPWTGTQNYSRYMFEVGLVDIVEKRYNWPLGPWAKGAKAKKIGVYFLEDLLRVVEPISMKLFIKVLGWDEERCRTFVAQLKAAMCATKTYAFQPMVFVCGRKPLATEPSTQAQTPAVEAQT